MLHLHYFPSYLHVGGGGGGGELEHRVTLVPFKLCPDHYITMSLQMVSKFFQKKKRNVKYLAAKLEQYF